MIFELGFLMAILFLGFASGRHIEKRHLQQLQNREDALLHLNASTFGKKDLSGRDSQLFVGSAVISVDAFKAMMASLRSIFGGRIQSYETLLARARREAMLRMKEKAHAWGAQEVRNIRCETSNIASNRGGNESSLTAVEVMAYGTGIKK